MAGRKLMGMPDAANPGSSAQPARRTFGVCPCRSRDDRRAATTVIPFQDSRRAPAMGQFW